MRRRRASPRGRFHNCAERFRNRIDLNVSAEGATTGARPGSYGGSWQLWRLLYDKQAGARSAGRGVTAGKLVHAKRPLMAVDHNLLERMGDGEQS
jgi:hypothetical protein